MSVLDLYCAYAGDYMGKLRRILLVLCVIANGNFAVLVIGGAWIASSPIDQEYHEVPQSLFDDDDDDGADDAVIAGLLSSPGLQLCCEFSAPTVIEHHDQSHPLRYV